MNSVAWRIAVLAMLAAAPGWGCRGAQVHHITYMVVAGTARGLAEDGAENGRLNPAAVEAIFFHPALPYAFGGHGGHKPGRKYLRTAELTVELNRILADNVRAAVHGGGLTVDLQVSRRTGIVTASWATGGELWPFSTQTVLFDLSRVAGAFDPSAVLTAATVARLMVVRTEEP